MHQSYPIPEEPNAHGPFLGQTSITDTVKSLKLNKHSHRGEKCLGSRMPGSLEAEESLNMAAEQLAIWSSDYFCEEDGSCVHSLVFVRLYLAHIVAVAFA